MEKLHFKNSNAENFGRNLTYLQFWRTWWKWTY